MVLVYLKPINRNKPSDYSKDFLIKSSSTLKSIFYLASMFQYLNAGINDLTSVEISYLWFFFFFFFGSAWQLTNILTQTLGSKANFKK